MSSLQEQDCVYLKVGKLILASVVHLIIEVSWGVAVFPARNLVGLFGSGGEAAMIASKRRGTHSPHDKASHTGRLELEPSAAPL